MAASYPSAIYLGTAVAGTTLVGTADHASMHNDAQNEINAIETTLGTNSGTSVLKNFVAGDFPVRQNASNVLQTAIEGTVNNSTLGSPSVTGGTIANMQLIGTSQITGGTANSIVLGTPTFVGAANNYVYSTSTGTSTTGTAYASMYGANLKGTVTTTNSHKVRIMLTVGDLSNNGASNPLTYIQIVRNPAGSPGTVARIVLQGETTPLNKGFSLFSVDSPTTGANVYDVQWKVSSGTATTLGAGGMLNYSIEEINT